MEYTLVFMTKLDWAGIAQACSGLAMVLIAYKALSSWQIQQKTAQVNTLLDELLSEVNEFIRHAVKPVQYCHIRFESHKDYYELDKSLSHPEIVYVIKKFGKEHSEQLFSSLELCGQNASKIKSLIVRIELHQIHNFNECINACNYIVWQHDRMQAFASILGRSDMNWDNPLVAKSLENLLEITSDDIERQVNENYANVLVHIKSIYDLIYKKPNKNFKRN